MWSGILFSTSLIFLLRPVAASKMLVSVIFVFKTVAVNKPLVSGIFYQHL